MYLLGSHNLKYNAKITIKTKAHKIINYTGTNL